MKTIQEMGDIVKDVQISIRYLWAIVIMLFVLLVFVTIGYTKLHIRISALEQTVDTLTKPPKTTTFSTI